MSDRKLAKKLQPILKQVWKLSRRLSKTLVNWLLRTVFLLNRQPRNAGFVLPTTVFLILVVSLTVGALTFRAFNSTTRTIGNVKSREIYNAATPAIDRARSKLDYLFGKDVRLPSGTPSEEFLIGMLLNEETRPVGPAGVKVPALTTGANPYTLSDERRVDINGVGGVDNAWTYKDGDNAIIYSINFSTPDDPDPDDEDEQGPVSLLKLDDGQKATGNADGPYVRSGPQSNSSAVKCRTKGGGSKVEGGWFQDVSNTSILRKRFQIDALVVNQTGIDKANPVNFTTLEFLQDYKLDRGNKWGAWFKYDLEAVSGAQMNWNGAMHSEGNIFIGRDDGRIFNSFLISATKSCLFKPESNSEISVREFILDRTLPLTDSKQINGGVAFKGIIAGAEIGRNTEYKSSQRVDKYKGAGYESKNFNPGNDWAKQSKDVIGISTDPVKLLTEDIHQAVTPDVTNKDDIIDNIEQTEFNPGRFVSDASGTQPYVDDLYRADDRYGPKVRYNAKPENRIPSGTVVGANIPASIPDLINNVFTTGTPPGLDGYWERRTFKDSDISSSKVYTGGMRILVGERLELGNPYGWVAPQDRPVGNNDAAKQDLTSTTISPGNGTFDNLRTFDPNTPANNYLPATVVANNVSLENSDNPGDPLYPSYAYTGAANDIRKHENKQRRALRDNLAAVQAATVYHYRIGDGRTPAACLALTAHPGSPYTLRQSVNFSSSKAAGGSDPLVDFFYGKGTNGWEFTPPDITSGTMQTALANLANFAGELDGAFPPKQESAGGKIHPDPTLTMWGNFSNLKRALEATNNSPADQSYKETAGCMLGMLAYNINQVQKFDPAAAANQANQATLGADLYKLMDGDTRNGEILPSGALATYNYTQAANDDTAVPALSNYNPRDYDRATPEMFLAKLLEQIRAAGGADPENNQLYQLGTLIHEHFQIRRDRTYGFRPSPAANTWNYNPYLTAFDITGTTNKPTLWSSACDPNIFAITGATSTGSTGATALNLQSSEARYRLALSRLCGTVIPPGAVHDYPGDNSYPSRATGGILEEVVGVPAADTLKPIDATATNAEFNRVSGSGTPPNNTIFSDPVLTAAPANLKRALVSPKFPSLYYIFPEFDHDWDGDSATVGGIPVDHRQPGNPTLDTLPAAFQPWVEPYIKQTPNTLFLYQPVSAVPPTIDRLSESYSAGPYAGSSTYNPASTAPTGIEKFSYKPFQVFPEEKLVDLGVSPRPISEWVLPTIADPDASDPPNPNRIIATDGSVQAIPFQDKVAFNGREWLPARVLDIDLDMLRNSDKGVGNDTWLPVTGIVYAFREDAVREDAIARPASTLAYTDAQTPGAETDPKLNAAFNVSTKPVDFIADPDRRPHGFRLRNGAILKRGGSVKTEDNFHGLSLITDQPAYVMGDFNLHQDTDGKRLEEFMVQLPANPVDYTSETFYDNRDDGGAEERFADPDADLWRPSEILADSVTILSDRFCDGSAIDTFMTAGPRPTNNDGGIGVDTSSGSNATKAVYKNGSKEGAQVYNDTTNALFGSANGCLNSDTEGATSFLNQNRPMRDLTDASKWNWVRENPGDPIYSPVKISRNGNGLIAKSLANGSSVPVEYSSGNDIDPLIKGEYMDNKNSSQSKARALQKIPQDAETGVNVIMVSGVVPARQFQGYGALSNFPRFLENWDDGKTSLRFAGSFLQLNFSNYSTGPYDDDSWEPGETPIGGSEVLPYRPPARLWGYDVALQLAQASPAASRFTSLSNEKNEFYAEPSGSDPYMQFLCSALKAQPPSGFDPGKLNCPA
ncbi:hypothetical protein JOY44_16890 [Phormidium sp. CLA17]|uniref:hormogonium polysaccharide biosynthesis protein HpsA n=1 Tax=Leptolyngbya sp. Cla-17 TaxID=2803751 RepID=UPI0014931F1E|nr:hormogonium polysaccharide biosynthesis protein HpsA [Leptolyngbya sp. Cla-17]MBM0743268.1 hypothetical protein [Leptolyngbya sp. Cla-17]